MNRIDHRLRALAAGGEKALALFLTAGFPRRDSTVPLVLELEKSGADIIELGMPFSDPLADGPVIQQSSAAALRNGVTLDHIFRSVEEIRKQSQIPLVLMGYINPIMKYGVADFFAEAARVGVDGMILPELPLEESGRFRASFEQNGLANILLVAPTSSDERVTSIDSACSGFLYCVSTTGVTGSTGGLTALSHVQHVRALARKNPVMVGFGISRAADAAAYARAADGVIIGSALLKRLGDGVSIETLHDWVKEIKAGLRVAE